MKSFCLLPRIFTDHHRLLTNLVCLTAFCVQFGNVLEGYINPVQTNIRVGERNISAFPLVFKICFSPGLNITAIEEAGYKRSFEYFYGQSRFNSSILGWAGHTNSSGVVGSVVDMRERAKLHRVEEVIESVHRASFAGLGSLLRCFADPRLVARFPGGNMAIARGAVARVVSNQGLVCLTEEQLCSVNFLAEGINGRGYARAITLIFRHTKVKEVVIDANDEFKVIFSNEEDLEVICREFFDPSFDSMESLERAGRRSCLVTRRDKGRAQGKFFILLTTSQDRLELRDFSKFIGGTRTVVVEEGKVLVSTKQLLVDILTDQAVVAKYPSLQLVNSNFWFKSDRGKWRPRQKAEGS